MGLVAFFSALFAMVFFLEQGTIMLLWCQFNGDGFGGLENEFIFFVWAFICLVLGFALYLYARYVWAHYYKREKDLPLLIGLIPMFPFLAQGIALLCYWATREGAIQFESGTALVLSIVSLSIAFTLVLTRILVGRYRSKSHTIA